MSPASEETTPPSMPVSELSYTEASRELDGIVEFFEQREVDVDQLVARLERATAIVDELDRRIRRTRAQVEQLVPRLQAATRGTASGERDPATREPISDDLPAAGESADEDPDVEAVARGRRAATGGASEAARQVREDRSDGGGQEEDEEGREGDENPLF